MNPQLFDQMRALEARHWWFCGRRRIVAHLIRRHLTQPHPRILEMGCGVGGNLAMLGTFGEVTGVEIDPHGLELAASRSSCRLLQGGLPDAIPEALGADFDAALMLDVLEHIEADGEALRALAGVVRPGGLLLLTVPACPFLWSVHDDYHHHKRRYMRDGLAKVVEANGWRIETLSYFNTLLFPLALVSRWIEQRHPPTEEALLKLPPAALNRLLEATFSFERWLVGRLPLPIGLSLVVVAHREA